MYLHICIHICVQMYIYVQNTHVIFTHICMHIYVCVHIYTFICTKIYPCSKHSCAHSVYISRDVRMCALPSAAWLTPDPSSATERGHSSSRFRLARRHEHRACTAAGGRGCRRQKQCTGSPMFVDVARARSLAVSLLFGSFFRVHLGV